MVSDTGHSSTIIEKIRMKLAKYYTKLPRPNNVTVRIDLNSEKIAKINECSTISYVYLQTFTGDTMQDRITFIEKTHTNSVDRVLDLPDCQSQFTKNELHIEKM